MDTYSAINDVLVKLINEIWELEGKAIITGEFKDITNNDMHIIEAIGTGDGDHMSSVARKVNVTVGTLTSAINSLVKKKYVVRERSEKDRRVVNIRLTEKGIRAYRHHEEYHHQMTEAIIDVLTEEEVPVLMKMLLGVGRFFREYENRDSQDGESKTEERVRQDS